MTRPRLALTTPSISTPERPELAHMLAGLSSTFRKVLSKHYSLGVGLGEAIELLDAFLTEIISAYDELSAMEELDEDGSPRFLRVHRAARELDSALENEMTFRHRYLYYRHIISRYSNHPPSVGSRESIWRAHYIRNLEREIEEMRQEFAFRAAELPRSTRLEDPFVL